MLRSKDGTVHPHQPHCLGCGPENPASLGLQFHIVGDRVHGRCTLDRRHEGAPGFAHGGAVAAAMDDLLGTVLIVLEQPAVTASLSVDFRSPALLGHPLDLLAWAERVDGRKLHLRGTIHDEGRLVAEATALFLAVDITHFEQSGAPLPDAWRTWGRAR